ncbi:hypothetical protein, partial [Desulfoprunum benzoelyticum]|uniref:hypothetical protein n=1 Tax=Desulfoprunum benzoelyticum TaxID=1506996 RepID=UPI001C8500A0
AMFIVKLLHDKRWSHYDSSVQGKTDAVILTDTLQLRCPNDRQNGAPFAVDSTSYDSAARAFLSTVFNKYSERSISYPESRLTSARATKNFLLAIVCSSKMQVYG